MSNNDKDLLLKKLLNEDPHILDKYIANKEGMELDFIIFGGLAGFCALTLVQIILLSSVDTPLTIAIYSFTVALPILLMKTINLAEAKTAKYEIDQPDFVRGCPKIR